MRKRSPRLKNSSIALAVTVLLSAPLQVLAQNGMATADGGTIDIQANEQEFADDQVIARGNVHVVYKDSVIDAPMATLFKDAAGKPQKAIFTGHPHLRQGSNIIHADKLTFEMLSSIIICDGNAHSEVIPEDAGATTKPLPQLNGKGAAKKPPVKTAKVEDDGNKAPDQENNQDGEKVASTEDGSSPDGKATAATPAKPAAAPLVKREKIITDSDHQIFNRETGQFDAHGNVRVKTGDIFVTSNSVKLVYDADKHPETALFTGNVKAIQNSNKTDSDVMTYFLTTKRLQATGHVKSTVVQEKNSETPKKGGPLTATASNSVNTGKMPTQSGYSKISATQPRPVDVAESADASNQQVAEGTDSKNSASGTKKEPIYIWSDAQDYSENTGRCTADGNVKMLYNETVGVAPKMIMIKNVETGETEKVILLGRCQVTQPGKRWIADRIIYTIATDRVEAEGNTKAFILKQKEGNGPMLASPGTKLLASPGSKIQTAQELPSKSASESTLASDSQQKSTGNNNKLSATKVETPK